jgi:hypothetical protein
MPSAVSNGGVAGALRAILWECQKEVPDSLAPRNPYWRRILIENAALRPTLIGRHLILIRIDHIAVDRIGRSEIPTQTAR